MRWDIENSNGDRHQRGASERSGVWVDRGNLMNVPGESPPEGREDSRHKEKGRGSEGLLAIGFHKEGEYLPRRFRGWEPNREVAH